MSDATIDLDTIDTAARYPDRPQPWAELGLNDDEYARIRQHLGRRPTDAELGMYSVMWSEHCSYKSSKVHLKKFGELEQRTPRGAMLAGIGENAGVVDIGHGYAVTFKAESHNHPTYIDPYHGAATGIGGIVRDILAMGARPIAMVNAMRFGPMDAEDTRRLVHGAVAGASGYANTLGLPTVGSETGFDASYAANPLLNALCVGASRHEDVHLAHASGAGNKVILYGAKTGADGIGGVSVLASEAFDETESGDPDMPAVPAGDPSLEKRLIECTLELFHAGIIAGIQDLGGAGISCATSELASAGDGGMHIDLDTVPVAGPLAPEQVLMSETQERMMAVVEPQHVGTFMRICERWDIEAAAIGEVTDRDNLEIDWHGARIVDVPPHSVAEDGPEYERPAARPAWLDSLQADTAGVLRRPASPAELRAHWLTVMASPDLADKSWITDQYDQCLYDQCSGDKTVLAHPENAGMVRVDANSNLGIAVAADCNGRFSQLDPYAGAQLALAEAYRNVAVTGAEPLAITDCLNFGSPEDPAVMWQFEQATRGLKDACAELGTPVVGGNVSFYNQTGQTPILPSPVVGALGVIDDVAERVGSGFRTNGEHILLLGTTCEELDGSAWAQAIHGHLGGLPPQADLAAEQALAGLIRRAAEYGLLTSAHVLSNGGLAAALAESALRGGVGARISLEDPFVQLFSESSARALVTVYEDNHERFVEQVSESGLELTSLGRTGGEWLEVHDVLRIPITELRAAWSASLPAVFGSS